MRANTQRQNFSSFIWSFESEKCEKEGKKMQNIETRERKGFFILNKKHFP